MRADHQVKISPCQPPQGLRLLFGGAEPRKHIGLYTKSPHPGLYGLEML